MVHGFVVADVNGEGDVFYYVEGVGEGFLEGLYDDDRVDIAFELREGLSENLASYYNSSASLFPA